ncbi:MAG: menaquinone biosynthesis protein [Fibrobacter sp.]|jgi:chorismate dehydratase|nr:menaquinone biosynthesis protein [Fibrobacter sp.]
MKLSIGRIPFLVCAPFFHAFTGNEEQYPDFSFEDGAPTKLNAGLFNGQIHLAPASSLVYGIHPENFVLAPRLCTSCRLEVQSVKLFSHSPWENLSGKRVHFTPQSATSVALVRVLSALRFHVQPDFIANESFTSENFEARLLIGDEALLENQKDLFEYRYDLAAIWEEWQKLPFVFGAWSIHRSALRPEMQNLVHEFLAQVENSVRSFRENPAAALEKWRARYPVSLPNHVIEHYYASMDYAFTEERKQSLSLFFKYCTQLGIIAAAPKLEFLEP